jgi:hypothetical protein
LSPDAPSSFSPLSAIEPEPPPEPEAPPPADELAARGRRRFKELWKEMLLGRILPGIAAGLAFLYCAHCYGLRIESFWLVTALLVPSLLARRGWSSVPTMLAAAGVAFMAAWGSRWLLMFHTLDTWQVIGISAAAVGLAEGVIERSVAVAVLGMLGGFGAAALLAASLGGAWLAIPGAPEALSPLIEHAEAFGLYNFLMGASVAVGRHLAHLRTPGGAYGD